MQFTPAQSSIPFRTNDLARRYIEDFSSVSAFYQSDFHQPEHLAAVASRLVNRTWRPRFQRDALADTLAAYLDAFPASSTVHANVDKLRRRDSVCVVTGQQPGFAGGPAYTLYKAATTLLLARDLEHATGQPVVPVFWNASDDSDIDEINRFSIVDDVPHKFRFKLPSTRLHVRDINTPAKDDPQWQALRELFPTGDHSDSQWWKLLDTSGRDFGTSFTRLMLDWFSAEGLVVVEPKALTELPAWRKVHDFELQRRDENRRLLRRVSGRLESRGMDVGVKISNHLNLFLTRDKQRLHLTSDENRIRLQDTDERFSMTALRKTLREDPSAFTPNVLLRPLVQSAIFPTVAYVGGPSEIAYHAVLKSLHRQAKVAMPVLFPRMSLTVLDESDHDQFERVVAFRRKARWRVEQAKVLLENTGADVREAMDDLRRELKSLERPLAKDIDRLEQRTLRSVRDAWIRAKQDPTSVMQDSRGIESALVRLFPNNVPQERFVTSSALLATHGPRFIDALMHWPDVFDLRHHTLNL